MPNSILQTQKYNYKKRNIFYTQENLIASFKSNSTGQQTRAKIT